MPAIHFPVGLLRDIHREAHTNVLYDLASAERLDGLIIWAGALNWFVGREELQDLFRRYQPVPIVNGKVAIEGIPSHLIDDYQGTREAVAHLYKSTATVVSRSSAGLKATLRCKNDTEPTRRR